MTGEDGEPVMIQSNGTSRILDGFKDFRSVCAIIFYLPPELWVKNLEEMLRLSLEL